MVPIVVSEQERERERESARVDKQRLYLLGHVEQQERNDETHSLAVSDALVVHRVRLECVEERRLTHSTLLAEEDVLGEGSVDVALNLRLER